jgi:hypothetical protein
MWCNIMIVFDACDSQLAAHIVAPVDWCFMSPERQLYAKKR